jgi:small subunit ribosomal protein S13e
VHVPTVTALLFCPQVNRKDKDGKFHLILVESRIHRLARYYKKTKKLAPNFKYESSTASTLVQG